MAVAGRTRVVLGSGVVLATVALLVAQPGCGSRGPLDDTPINYDAAPDVADVEVDAAPEAAPPADARPETGGVLGCASCVFTSCGQQILGCLTNQGCLQVFQCVASQCLGGGGGGGGSGGLNPICLFQCASGDPQGALQVLQIFQCINGTCGPDCTALLGGLGGLGGGGGGGGGGRDAGRRDGGQGFKADDGNESLPSEEMSSRYRVIFSPWPAMSSSFEPRGGSQR